MARRIKLSPNDPCPCWSGKKFKHCCRGVVDWERILNAGEDYRHLMSIRGRNLLFIQAIADALGLDNVDNFPTLASYKKAFTANAVKKIYEAVVDIWPIDTDIRTLLEKSGTEVSGLYIGDYNPDYLKRAIVRHSIYANKILLVDPFQHPYILADEYNPILNPAQHRTQTLKNVNLYLSLLPWIDAGIVEIIRTPADFDRKLNFDSVRAAERFNNIPDIRAALDATVDDLKTRHTKKQMLEQILLSMPDDAIRRDIERLGLAKGSYTANDFIQYVQSLRDQNADFLEPLGMGESNGQLHMMYSGGTFDVARLTAQISHSYLFTDLRARWAMIEHDRKEQHAENAVWAPFAKAMQNVRLNYLNNLDLSHALKLRQEGRLLSVRSLLTQVWDKVRSDDLFDEAAAIHLATHLTDTVNVAEAEWLNIKKDMIKYGAGGLAAGAASAGPLVASGNALWAGAAAIAGTAGMAIWTQYQKASFLRRYPAAFFMNLTKED